MDGPERFRSMRPWLIETFGRPVHRVALDAGSTPCCEANLNLRCAPDGGDSVVPAPGAGDDVAGVAALLEVLRIVRDGAPYENTLRFVWFALCSHRALVIGQCLGIVKLIFFIVVPIGLVWFPFFLLITLTV